MQVSSVSLGKFLVCFEASFYGVLASFWCVFQQVSRVFLGKFYEISRVFSGRFLGEFFGVFRVSCFFVGQVSRVISG